MKGVEPNDLERRTGEKPVNAPWLTRRDCKLPELLRLGLVIQMWKSFRFRRPFEIDRMAVPFMIPFAQLAYSPRAMVFQNIKKSAEEFQVTSLKDRRIGVERRVVGLRYFKLAGLAIHSTQCAKILTSPFEHLSEIFAHATVRDDRVRWYVWR